MPYIRRDYEDRPWFGALNDNLDQQIQINNGTYRDMLGQAGEQRANAEYDRRTANNRGYAEQQAAAERQRTGRGQGLMLDALKAAGIIKDAPETQQLRAGVEKDGLPGFQQMMEMYAQKVYRDQQEKKRMDEEAALASRAGDLQTMYEGTGGLPSQQGMPEGVAGPGLRTPALQNPADVNAAASVYGQGLNRQATQADREADNARNAEQFGQRQDVAQQRLELDRQRVDVAQQRLELDRQRVEAYIQSVQARGTPPTEDDIAGLADAIQASNPGIPASQAMGIARARLQYKAPMQIPTETLAQKGTREVVKGQLGELRAVRRSLLGPNGRLIARKIGQGMGIPEVPGAGGKTDPDMAKIAEALDGKIGDLEAKLDTVGVAPAGARDPSVGASNSPDPQAAAAVDAMLKAFGG